MFRREPSLKLGDLVPRFRVLRRSTSAYEWMKARLREGHPPLLITPTVGNELSRSMQHVTRDWVDFVNVGIEEVYGVTFGKITDKVVNSIAELLGPAFTESIATTTNPLSEACRSEAADAVPDIVQQRVHFIQVRRGSPTAYVEACREPQLYCSVPGHR